MASPQDVHPTLAQLQAFDAGQLAPAERGTIERHLERCPACCGSLDTLPEGALEALLRAFAGPTEEAAPTTPADLVGHPRYRVLEVLGAGGMGVVYKAVHRLMERVVALKVLNPALTARPGFVERFRREVKAAARLAHPNIVTAYDADEAGETHFLVMEFVAGTSLDREVARRGPLPVRAACDLIRQAALGLQHAHERGMVHCDIKPANLLLTPSGQLKFLDFGLARVLEEGTTAGSSLPSGTLLGTPDYVAPEQARDPACADIRSDIYSLGCTLYHLLAGQPPFPGGTPLQKLLAHQECSPPPLPPEREVPEVLARLLEHMLAKDPAQRPPTPADVAAELAWLADPTVAAPAATRRRSRRPLLLAVAVALLAAGALVIIALRQGSSTPSTVEDRRDRPGRERPITPDLPALASAEALARAQRKVRDQAVTWLRANSIDPLRDALPASVASQIDKDLAGSEAFHSLLGRGLLKSSKPTLLVGRAGTLHVFELSPALTGDLPDGASRGQNSSRGDDRRRKVPRVILSGLTVEGADHLFPERSLNGSVSYRIVDRWPGGYSVRLTFYFGKRKRHVLVPHDRLPEVDQGTLRLSFPPLDDPPQVMPGPDVVFVEFVTQGAAGTVVESNAVAAAVRVMAPEAARPR